MYKFIKPPVKFSDNAFEGLQGNGGFPEILYPAIASGSPIENPKDSDWQNESNTIENIYGYFVHKDYLFNPRGYVEMLTSDTGTGTSGCWDGSWNGYRWEYIEHCYWISKEDYFALGGTLPKGYEYYIDIHGENPYDKVYEWYLKEREQSSPPDMFIYAPVETEDAVIDGEEVKVIRGGVIETVYVWFLGKGITTHYPVTPTVYVKEDDSLHIVWDDNGFNHDEVKQYYYAEGSCLIQEPDPASVLEHYEEPIREFVTLYLESVK